MKEIVQLTREEYESLAEKAGHNEKEILRQARKLYEENGICGIILDIECECDVSDRYSFKVSSHATEMMTRKFGRQIEDINHWNTLARRMELVRWKFIGLTVFGWLAALALAVITLIR